MQEKGPARWTQNNEPLPKVNRYLSHILFFPKFYFLQTFYFSTACLNFQNLFCMLEFILALFCFYKNLKNISKHQNHLKKNIFWTSFRSKFDPSTKASKNIAVREKVGQGCQPVGPPGARPNPWIGRPRSNDSWAPQAPTVTSRCVLHLPSCSRPLLSK